MSQTKQYLGICVECHFTSENKKEFYTKKKCRKCYNIIQRVRNKVCRDRDPEKYRANSTAYMSRKLPCGNSYHQLVWLYTAESKRIRCILLPEYEPIIMV